jgi:hypothetical protein
VPRVACGKREARGRTRVPVPAPKSTTLLPAGGAAAESIDAKFST